MALATYSDLQSAVASWLHRSDLTSMIPTWIALAEANMSSKLKSRSMETRTNLTTTSTGVVATDAYLALPTDMVEMRRLRLTSTTPAQGLKYVTPDELSHDYPYDSYGQPQVFTVIGTNLQFAPVPDATYTVELTYMQRVPALSVSNTTNWVMTNWPDVYLYGTLLQAAPYLVDDSRIAVWNNLYERAIEAVNSVDWYSGSTLAVRNS